MQKGILIAAVWLASIPAVLAFPSECLKVFPLFMGLRLGPWLKGGAMGNIYAIASEGLPGPAVIKTFNTSLSAHFSEQEIRLRGDKYATLHDLLGECAVKPFGLATVPRHGLGIVMARIPDRYRVYDAEFVTPQTITDLKKISDTLRAEGLYITGFQFTVVPGGHVIVYDADELRSVKTDHPFHIRGNFNERALERFDQTIQAYIKYAEQDMQTQKDKAEKLGASPP